MPLASTTPLLLGFLALLLAAWQAGALAAPATFAALLVFGVGLGFAGFLW